MSRRSRPADHAQVADRRTDVLTALRTSTDPATIAQIAQRLRSHTNTVRFHLLALTESGEAERVLAEPSGPGRPPLLFQARRQMNPAGPRNYQLLAEILGSELAADPENAVTRATAAGQALGARLAGPRQNGKKRTAQDAVGWLLTLLDELGFAPEGRRSVRRREIGLRHCPFLDLVDLRERVICPAHLGLMQGAMSALGAPITVERLEPFAEPDLCRAHLVAARRTTTRERMAGAK